MRHYAAEAGGMNNPPFTTDNGRCCFCTEQCFETCSNFALYVHRNNPRNLFSIAQAALEPRWKPVFSRHHHDVRPRDCTVGGDNEPIEKQDKDPESFLHQHFPAKPQVKVTRSISMIILWRDQKSVLIKNDCCWRVNDSTEFDLPFLSIISSRIGIASQSSTTVNTGLCSRLIFPSGNHIHQLQHLKAFLELLFSTLNVPKCALMNRSTQILLFGWTHSSVEGMKAWRHDRHDRLHENTDFLWKQKKNKHETTFSCLLCFFICL